MILTINLAQFDYFCDIVLPILICVVLPIVIVCLVLRYRRHELDKRTEVLIKAIECGVPQDSPLIRQFVQEGVSKQKKNKNRSQGTLVASIILCALGLFWFILGIGTLFNDGEVEETSRSAIVANGLEALSFMLGLLLLLTGLALLAIHFVKKKSYERELVEAEKEAENGKRLV